MNPKIKAKESEEVPQGKMKKHIMKLVSLKVVQFHNGAQPDLGTQSRYKGPGDLPVKYVKTK